MNYELYFFEAVSINGNLIYFESTWLMLKIFSATEMLELKFSRDEKVKKDGYTLNSLTPSDAIKFVN